MPTYDSAGIIVFPCPESLVVLLTALRLRGEDAMYRTALHSKVYMKHYMWEDIGFTLPIMTVDVRGETAKHAHRTTVSDFIGESHEYGAMYSVYHQDVSGDDSQISAQRFAFTGSLHTAAAFEKAGFKVPAPYAIPTFAYDVTAAMNELITDTFMVMKVIYDEHKAVAHTSALPSVEDVLTDKTIQPTN